MPRTEIPVTTLSRNDSAAISWTAADATNNMYFENDGKTKLIVKNEDSSGKTATVKAVSDPYGRSVDESISAAAASGATPGINMTGHLDPVAWNQRGSGDLGRVHVDIADDTNLYLAAVKAS